MTKRLAQRVGLLSRRVEQSQRPARCVTMENVMTLSFSARKEGTRLSMSDPTAYFDAVMDMPEGRYTVTIEPETARTRGLAQNRYYWLLLTEIEKQTGQPKEDLHEYFKARFLRSGFSLVDIDGVVRDDVDVTKSTTRLSPEDMAEYCEKVRQLADEVLGCELLPEAS